MIGGFTAGGLDELRRTATQFIGDALVPGLVVLVASGAEVHVETFGTLAIDGPPVRRDSIFRIASMTKPMVAAAAMVLREEGRFDLDEPVERLLPELANPRVLVRMDGPLDETVAAVRSITVHDLLNFTFGFGSAREMFTVTSRWPVVKAARDLGLATLGWPEPARQPAPDQWMANLAELPLLAQPGERWLYNTGSSVLGVLLARAAGQPLADVMRTRLFEPLGMTDTGFWTSATDRLATAYRPTARGLQLWDGPAGYFSRPTAFPDGASGLVSTIDDVFAFTEMLRSGGGSVLPREAVGLMTSGQLSPDQRARGGFASDSFEAASWGYGLLVRDSGAYGWDGGFGSSMVVDSVRNLTVIVLTQRLFETVEPPPVHRELQAAAYAALA